MSTLRALCLVFALAWAPGAFAALLAAGGFQVLDLEQMYLPGTPRVAAYNYWGSARRD